MSILLRLAFTGIYSIILLLGIPFTALGQSSAPAVSSVPFVGCRSDGQVGPVQAPTGSVPDLPISRKQAQQLAYYKSAVLEIGVLAPRGWYCYGVYGSGGSSLLVVPEPVDPDHILSTARESIAGPAIKVALADGETSGRYAVAEVIGRVFPAYRDHAREVLELIDEELPSGPYPTDALKYDTSALVEYRTPANQKGLGTRWPLQPGERPIFGAAALFGEPPSLLLLAVRVPVVQEDLVRAIVARFEREVSRVAAAKR